MAIIVEPPPQAPVSPDIPAAPPAGERPVPASTPVRDAPWPSPSVEENPATITTGVAVTFALFGLVAALFLGVMLGRGGLPVRAGVSRQTAGPPVTLDVIASEFKFAPNALKMDAPGELTINLQNKGLVEHDVTIDGLKGKAYARAGETGKGTFTFTKAGTYTIYCSIPGHKDAGMTATLTVGAVAATAPVAQTAGVAAIAGSASKVGPVVTGAKPLPRPQIAPPVNRTTPATVQLTLETKEVTAQMADGVTYTYWTFGGTVPGPMLRVRQGDTVELTLKNAGDSKVTHSIDLHAVTGPGGGAKVTQVPAGGNATFRFVALNPGVYVYHCATAMVPHHIANGMYGLIVVEPPEGLTPVDREFYVMQGDFYLSGDRGQQGQHDFSMQEMLDERPDYVVFNGGVGAVTGEGALKAKVGETVRIFFGVGGPNITSSFHVIGEIFDRAYMEGASQYQTNVQTTLVPTGGAAMVEFKVEVPGTYTLVDHSLGRLEKGAAGFLEVEGPDNPAVFQSIKLP